MLFPSPCSGGRQSPTPTGAKCPWPVAQLMDPPTVHSSHARDARGVGVGERPCPGRLDVQGHGRLSATAPQQSVTFQNVDPVTSLPCLNPLLTSNGGLCVLVLPGNLTPSPPRSAKPSSRPSPLLVPPAFSLLPSLLPQLRGHLPERPSLPPLRLLHLTLSSAPIPLIANCNRSILCPITRILQLPSWNRSFRRAETEYGSVLIPQDPAQFPAYRWCPLMIIQ